MYSRQHNGASEISVPPNYSGNAFRQRRANVHITPERRIETPTPKPDKQRETKPIRIETADVIEEPQAKETFAQEAEQQVKDDEKAIETSVSAPSLLSPLGSLDTEEILLIALALIVFQSGKDPDLALILLALLFI